MDKMSTYHPAITEKAWLVVILTFNQIIATLYCVKVVVAILVCTPSRGQQNKSTKISQAAFK